MHPNRFHFSSVGERQTNTPSACLVKVCSRSRLHNVIFTHPQTSVVESSLLSASCCFFNAGLTVIPKWVAFIALLRDIIIYDINMQQRKLDSDV